MPHIKHALVTGGTRGIGSGISRALKNAGYKVSVTYFGNDERAQAFEKETGIFTHKWDVGDFDACAVGVRDLEKHYGPVDILINNAGITRDGFLHKNTPDMWQDVVRINLSSCYNMTRAVIEGMRERSFGRIVNISSINGVKGQIGQVNYAAAKAGIIGFTKSLALESAAKKITVNAIAPGYIATDMVRDMNTSVLDSIVKSIPAGRIGTVEDIARGVLFLIADDADFINGTTLHINGGQYLA